MYGGRGGGKSHSVAAALLLLGQSSQCRILCAREVQKSIKQSVHQLLSDTIQRLGLGSFYEVLESEIRGLNGTTISFAGLANNTVESIKSFEGVTHVWCEEAQTVSKRSWDILTPTIRKPGSEIWVTFNPFLRTDNTYIRFVTKSPDNAWVIKVNYDSNPWFPPELEEERLHCKENDPDNYNNIWEGDCLAASDQQLISGDLVYKAQLQSELHDTQMPLIISVDVARFGDDRSIIFFRRGRDARTIKPLQFKGMDTMTFADRIAEQIKLHKPAAVFIDETGVGGGVVDRLRQTGYNRVIRGVNAGEKARDPEKYYNKRAEMWCEMRSWLQYGKISNDTFLLDDLTGPEYSYDLQGRLQLEKKSDMKKRGLDSPDLGDALAYSFAYPVYAEGNSHKIVNKSRLR